MMDKLALQKCEACRKDSPHVTEEELAKYMPEIPGWKILETTGVKRLERTYTFKDFVMALAFTNRVGELAEEVGHHPALLTEWGKVTVGWWTHKIRGLHRNDFICAAKTDDLFASRA